MAAGIPDSSSEPPAGGANGLPPTPQTWPSRRTIVTIILVVGVLLGLGFYFLVSHAEERSPARFVSGSLAVWIFILIVAIPGLAMLSWFVWVFTLPIPGKDLVDKTGKLMVEPGELRSINAMFLFCYVYTMFTLIFPVLPALILALMSQAQNPGVAVGPTTSFDQIYALLMNSPVGLVKGCVHSDDDKWELACRKTDLLRDQWLVNIGGSALYRCASYDPNVRSKNLGCDPTTLAQFETSSDKRNLIDALATEDSNFYAVTLHGGVQVPLYVIIIAIMGAAVSIARKVPEYQRQLLDPLDSLKPYRARENLVFQILQVGSAPLIAIAAYDMIMPNTFQASVALAFISGFASETVLLAIRGLSDRLIPKATEAKSADQQTTKDPQGGAATTSTRPDPV